METEVEKKAIYNELKGYKSRENTVQATYPYPKLADEKRRYQVSFNSNISTYDAGGSGWINISGSDYLDIHKCILEFTITATGTGTVANERLPAYFVNPFDVVSWRTRDQQRIEEIYNDWLLEGALKQQTTDAYKNVIKVMNTDYETAVAFNGGKKIYWDFATMGLNNAEHKYLPLKYMKEQIQFHFKLAPNATIMHTTADFTNISYQVSSVKLHCEMVEMSDYYYQKVTQFLAQDYTNYISFPYTSYITVQKTQNSTDETHEISFDCQSLRKIFWIIRNTANTTTVTEDKLKVYDGANGVIPNAANDPTVYYQFKYANEHIPRDRVEQKRLAELQKLKALNKVKDIDGGMTDYNDAASINAGVKCQSFDVNSGLSHTQFGGIDLSSEKLYHHNNMATGYTIDYFGKYDAELRIYGHTIEILR